MSQSNGQSYTFAFKVTQLPCKGENRTLKTLVEKNRRVAFWALVRALASNPPMYLGLKDEECREFQDQKATPEELKKKGSIFTFKIEYHEIKL